MQRFIKFLISLIPVKSLRGKVRDKILHIGSQKIKKLAEKKQDLLKKHNDKTFVDYEIRENSVLIVEPNGYHSEILPGFVKYFQDLGFNVDVFLRHENDGDDTFCRFGENKPTFFKGTPKHLKTLLKLEKICDYEYVFLSSSAYWESNVYENSYLNYLEFVPKAKNGIMLIEHHVETCLKEYEEEQYLEQGRLFTLSGFQNTPMLNPHYWGEVEITKKSTAKTKFIVVGGINKYYKNHKLLIETVAKLINAGIEDFEVVVVGSGDSLDLPKETRPFIRLTGRLSFKQMFDEVEKADFFLPLLDLENKDHQRYLASTTSGSRQLILGFVKPCLINEEFAKVYSFDNENSILYQENELFESMQEAIDLSQNKYETMQNNLQKLANDVYKKSLNNLKTATVRIKNEK